MYSFNSHLNALKHVFFNIIIPSIQLSQKHVEQKDNYNHCVFKVCFMIGTVR